VSECAPFFIELKSLETETEVSCALQDFSYPLAERHQALQVEKNNSRPGPGPGDPGSCPGCGRVLQGRGVTGVSVSGGQIVAKMTTKVVYRTPPPPNSGIEYRRHAPAGGSHSRRPAAPIEINSSKPTGTALKRRAHSQAHL
jgi:hypothetical protein